MHETPDFSTMTRREIEDYLVERATVDSSFRERLKNEPGKLLRELGLPIGEGVSVRVFEEQPKSFYIVIPRILDEPEILDEKELDAISGGVSRGASEMRGFFRGYL